MEGKPMETPCFLEEGMMFNPHSRPESTWMAVPFPDLHSAASRLIPQGHDLQVMPVPKVNVRFCGSWVAPRYAPVGSTLLSSTRLAVCWGNRSPRGWEGLCTHVLSTHAHAWPSARCEPFCCEPPPLCLHFSVSFTTHCGSYI